MAKWIPREKGKHKTEDGNSVNTATASVMDFPSIQGIDTAKGIAMTGGTAEGYRQVLSMFRKDAEDRLQKFRFFLYEGMSSGRASFPEKHLSSFITQIHALKSASGTIGAAEISDKASQLETAGKNNNLPYIQDNLPDFVELLTELDKNIRTALEPKSKEVPQKTGGLGSFFQMLTKPKPEKTQPVKTELSEFLPVFHKLKDALEAQNVSDIDQILDDLSKKAPDSKTKEILEQISDQVLMTEFDSAKKTVEEFLAANK